MEKRILGYLALICFAVALLLSLPLLSGCSDDDQGTISGSGDDRSDRVRDGGPTKKAPMPNQDDGDSPSTPTAADYPHIAGRGILWKPVSDSDHNLAVLLNPSFGNPGVRVLSMSGSTIATGKFVYYSNPDRATYRFNRAGGSFPRPCLLQVGGQIFLVPDGSKRYE